MFQERSSRPGSEKSDLYHNSSELNKAASKTFEEGKQQVKNLYEQGKEKLSEMEGSMEEYANQLARNVKENPITSIVIAAGIGFILSSLLKK